VVYGTSSALGVLLVAGILVVAALLANRYHLRWDLTRGQSQSLRHVTTALLAEVNKPLTMTVFFPEGQGERQQAKDVLERYTYQNRRLTFQFVDPERDPLKAREAGYRFAGNVLLEYEGRRQMADKVDEESLTNALRKILKPEHKRVYFLTGHGERDTNDAQQQGFRVAKKALENEGLEVQGLSLLTVADVPQDASVLIVAGPRKALLANEVAALKAYLNRGGKLLVLLEALQDAGLKDFLAGYGVEINDGMILDMNQVSQALGASAVMPLVVQYGPHRITRDFANVVTLYPLARPLNLKSDVQGVALLPLASTTATSWEKLGKDWMKEKKPAFDAEKDRKGPFILAVLAEITPESPKPDQDKKQPQAGKKPQDNKAYLTVFGDVDFAANAYFNLFGNGDLFLNTVNFLAAEEKMIIIRQDERRAQPLILGRWQIWTLFVTCLVVIPLIMLGGGIWAYRRRRARR
jgi:ABC-type uncharacterized transport system involved in gliding motility auxiliary subunit